MASASDEGYCTGALKQILRRVLTSCGLIKGGSQRGCQPLQARSVAAMSGDDFNALFVPLADRAAIIQFDQDSAELDSGAIALLDKTFAAQRGASYFLVVSRASTEGALSYNRELSRKRAEAVLDHIRTKFSDPDLDQEVGLLWLGAEYAQLDKEFCQWQRSRPDEAVHDRPPEPLGVHRVDRLPAVRRALAAVAALAALAAACGGGEKPALGRSESVAASGRAPDPRRWCDVFYADADAPRLALPRVEPARPVRRCRSCRPTAGCGSTCGPPGAGRAGARCRCCCAGTTSS